MRSMSAGLRRLITASTRPRPVSRHPASVWKPSSAIRPFLPLHPALSRHQRYSSSLTAPDGQATDPQAADEPSYQLSFTCKPCLFRSTHRVTKHGYHHGTVLITCPSCKSRHVIADHLRVFLDASQTLEDILREKAENGEDFTRLLKKGKLGIRPGELVGNEGEEDVEFWEDGTETTHTPIERDADTKRGDA